MDSEIEREENATEAGDESNVENGREEAREVETKEDSSPAEEKRKKKYLTKHMILYPELYRSDVSIHPSYTTLKNLP